MFHSISLQEFFSAITMIVVCYYFITTILLYSSEVRSIFDQKRSKQTALTNSIDQNDSNEPIELMGSIKHDTKVNVPHENVIDAQDVNVVNIKNAKEEKNELRSVNQADALLEGSAIELKQELTSIVKMVSEFSKGEASSVIQSLLSRYSELVGGPHQEAISQFIYKSCKEQCAFELEPNEIDLLWPMGDPIG